MEATFTREMWDETGEDGWVIRGCSEAYDPVGPLGVAHDFFEHNANLETIQDEIMAHGAMYRLRWETGYVYRVPFSRGPETIGYEFENLISGMYYADLAPAPDEPELEEHVEADLAAIIVKGLTVEAYDDEVDRLQWLAQHYAGWFRKGYRWAEEHYECGAERAVYDGFQALEQHLEELEKQELYTGDRLTVRFDPVTAELDVRLERQCAECMGFCNVDDFLCDDCREANEEYA